MAEFNGAKITEYKDGRDTSTGTLARGSTFNNEFNRLYANDNYLKDEIDKLGGASLDTDGALLSNSDTKIPSQKAVKTYIDSEISELIGGAPSALDTLNELAAALNDDAGLATTLLSKIEASEQQNLVYNYDFRFFSNQLSTIASWYSYKHPDGWIFTDSGTDGKIGYDTASECCKFQTSSDGTGTRSFKQALHEFVNWKKLLQGKTVTLKAFVKGANATVIITDGVTSQSAALQNTGGIEEITLQIAVSAAATELTVLMESSTASNTIEVYKVYANRGNYAIETLPCIIQGKIGELKSYDATEIAPAGEFQVYSMEVPAGYTRLDSFINGKFGRGANGRSKLDDALGRYDRNWANGSANDPDRASRTDRGDGTTGDSVGTKLKFQMQKHKHRTPLESQSPGATDCHSEFGGATTSQTPMIGGSLFSGYPIYTGEMVPFLPSDTLQVGNQTNPIDRNILKTIRWC